MFVGLDHDGDGRLDVFFADVPPDPIQEAESAVKSLRDARDQAAKQRATRALEKALQRLKGQAKPEGAPKTEPAK